MIRSKAVKKYQKYFHNGDRSGIFELLAQEYHIKKALYPGSYIHITPSFYFPTTVYIDNSKKATDFFEDKGIYKFISKNRGYQELPKVIFHYADYNSDFEENPKSFDLLISQHVAFVSQSCKKYLKTGGILMANNSHGDASMAFIDTDYEFIAVIHRENRSYYLTDKNLEKYFIPRNSEIELSKDYLEQINRGIEYTKIASSYIFKNLV